MYKLKPNSNLEYAGVAMDADHCLTGKTNTMAEPLDVIVNGSLILIIGSSGSGKTSLLMNLIAGRQKMKNGKKQSFYKCFDKVIVCSPSMHTLTNNKAFSDLPENQVYNDFGETMDDLGAHLDESKSRDDRTFNLLILDDCAAALRSNRTYETYLTATLQNRRHQNLTTIIIVQSYRQLPTQIRNNANVIFIFKPKTMQEMEAITTELLPIPKKDILGLFGFIFDDGRYNHLMIDQTLTHSNKYRLFKNFQEIIL